MPPYLSQAPAGDDDLRAPPGQLERGLVPDADAAPRHEGHPPPQALVAAVVPVQPLLDRPNHQGQEEQAVLNIVQNVEESVVHGQGIQRSDTTLHDVHEEARATFLPESDGLSPTNEFLKTLELQIAP